MSVGDAVRGVVDKGRGALMAKVDMKSVYWQIPIHRQIED